MTQPHQQSQPDIHTDGADGDSSLAARRAPPVVDAEVVEEATGPAAAPRAEQAEDSSLARLKARLKPLLETAHRAFTEHPAAAGETYWQHLLFTLGMGARLMFAGFVILLHGILPFALTYTGSKHLKKCNKILSERAKTAQMADESPMPYGDHI
ncbi:MAG: DUF6356 family protein [Alphaproteobacteria bacterium]|nr:DUF6356 family protein [Alphaproteobacteria bacterium]